VIECDISLIRSKAMSTPAPPFRFRRIRSNTASSLPLVTMASPSIRNERAGSADTAAAARGNRDVKSLPPRVMSRKAGINYKFESGVSAAVGPKNSGRHVQAFFRETFVGNFPKKAIEPLSRS
jgi:hypothetical protein